MRKIVIEGVEHVISCNAYTPYVYSENFTAYQGGNLVKDDVAVAINDVIETINTVGFPPLMRMLQLFWAFEKSTRPATTPDFTAWLKDLPPMVIDLEDEGGWAHEVMEEIRCSFFRTSSPTTQS